MFKNLRKWGTCIAFLIYVSHFFAVRKVFYRICYEYNFCYDRFKMQIRKNLEICAIENNKKRLDFFWEIHFPFRSILYLFAIHPLIQEKNN